MDQPSSAANRRLAREKRTIEAMLAIYCRAHHAAGHDLCADCDQLMQYALCRLDRCPFGAAKTTCARCPIHCYSPRMRAQIKEVMRFAGRRMAWRHPLLAARHWCDSFQGNRTRHAPRDVVPRAEREEYTLPHAERVEHSGNLGQPPRLP